MTTSSRADASIQNSECTIVIIKYGKTCTDEKYFWPQTNNDCGSNNDDVDTRVGEALFSQVRNRLPPPTQLAWIVFSYFPIRFSSHIST